MRLVGRFRSGDRWSRKGKQRVVRIAGTMVVASGIAVFFWSYNASLSVESLAGGLPRVRPAPLQEQEKIPAISSFASIWGKPMRRPLVDPAKSVVRRRPAEPPKRKVPRPAVTLLGIYGGRFAVFRVGGAGSKEVTVAEGEQVGNAVVERVGAGRVTLSREGESFDFEVPRRGGDRK